MSEEAAGTVTVFSAARACENLYEQLCSLSHETYGQVSASRCLDERGRFKIWANNIGALLSSHKRASLDFRLRDITKVRNRVIKLLQDLRDSLTDVLAIISGQRSNRTLPSDSNNEEESSEVLEAFETAQYSVTSLMKVSIVIRNATPRDRYLKAEMSATDRFMETFDIDHVTNKYRKVDKKPWLRDRLGRAITKRRQFLQYCRGHHEKFSEENAHTAKTIIASTKASTMVAGQMDRLEVDDNESQTSFATSFADEEDGEENKLLIPRFPNEDPPFECPLCYNIQDIRSQQAWKRHVFRDLRPYVCTFEMCDVKLFESRHKWFEHELEYHRKNWACKSCNHPPFESRSKFVAHTSEHFPAATTDLLDNLAKASSLAVHTLPAASCPLCDWKVPSQDSSKGNEANISVGWRRFRKHLGRHMEQLALFALPKTLTAEDAEDDSVDTGASKDEYAENSGNERNDQPELQFEDDPDEPKYCTCGKLPDGKMIVCGNPECRIKWFHFECSGLSEDPADDSTWYCSICTKNFEKEKILQKLESRLEESELKQTVREPLEEFEEGMRKTLANAGYTDERIERIVQQPTSPSPYILPTPRPPPRPPLYRSPTTSVVKRPTYIRVERKHLDPETLGEYQLPWDWDDADSDYIIIKQWISEPEQKILFEHTRRLKEKVRVKQQLASAEEERATIEQKLASAEEKITSMTEQLKNYQKGEDHPKDEEYIGSNKVIDAAGSRDLSNLGSYSIGTQSYDSEHSESIKNYNEDGEANKIVDVTKYVPRSRNSNTRASMADLATVYSNQGRLQEAEEPQVEVLKNPTGDSSLMNTDAERNWRSEPLRKAQKQVSSLMVPDGAVSLAEMFRPQYGYEMIITERYFDEGRWGWNYKLKDKSNVRQSGIFYETDLELW